jgi:hypothetical protein
MMMTSDDVHDDDGHNDDDGDGKDASSYEGRRIF